MKPGRILAYARVSSLEQTKGTSLADQRAAIAAYARSVGRQVVKEYVESESASGENIAARVQVAAAIRDARSGDTIVVHRLDRWSRDIVWGIGKIRELAAQGIGVYSIQDGIDSLTRQGNAMLGYRLIAAENERELIRERTVGARKRLRDEGYRVEGRVPPGYKRKREASNARTAAERAEVGELLIDEPAAAKIQSMFAACIAGKSFLKIAAEYGMEEGAVHKTLKRRFYIGEIQNSAGEWIRGKHPALIDRVTFAKAQDAMKARRVGGPKPRGEGATAEWWLRDLATCALCGGRLTSAWSAPKGSPRRHSYYLCLRRTPSTLKHAPKGSTKCSQPYIPQRDVEDRASVHVLARLFELRKELAAPPKAPVAPVLKSNAEKRAALVLKRERYVDAYASGLMTKAALTAKVADIDAKLLQLEADEPTPSPLADTKRRKALLTTVTGIAKAWEHAAPKRRRQIVNLLATSVALGTKGVHAAPGFKWRSAEELALTDVVSLLKG